jgi:hypothetical protein
MKLREFLEKAFQYGPLTYGSFTDYVLKGDVLKECIPQLLECDEFKDVTNIKVVDTPSYWDDSIEGIRQNKIIQTYNLLKDECLCGDIILYIVGFLPPVYDIKDLLNPVKNGCSISPTLYSPEDFLPIKKIMLSYSPEIIADDIHISEYQYRKKIHDILDDILDHQEEYLMKERNKGIFIRGNITLKTQE